MASAISVALGVSGAKEFQDQIKKSNAAIKLLGDELKLSAEKFKGAEDAEQGFQEQNDVLQRTVDTLKEKLELQEEALKKVADKFGEASTETIRMKDEVVKTRTQIEEATNKIKENSDAVENLGEEEDKASDKTAAFGDVLKANLASEAILKGVEKLAGAIKDVTLGAAQAADDIATLSTKTGLSTDMIQEFKYMEGLADVDLDTLTGSMSKLIKQMSSAKSGTGNAAESFEALGISVTDAQGNLRDNQDVFFEAINALGAMTNETERDATAMELFGKSAQDLNPLIAIGSEGMQQLAQEAHDVGYVMDSETLDSLLQAADASDRMNASVEALKNSIGAELAPVLTTVLEYLTNLTQAASDAEPIIVGLATAVGLYAAAMAISSLIDKVKTATENTTIAQAALNAVMEANPVAIVVGLLAGLVTALVTAYRTNDDFREKVDNAWKTLKDTVTEVGEKIKETVDDVVTWFEELPEKALKWGKDMIQSFLDGIKKKAKALLAGVEEIAQSVKDFLGFSEPKKGPLSNFHTYAPDMMKLYAQGIRDNAYLVNDAIDGSISSPVPVHAPMQATIAGAVNGMQTVAAGAGNGFTVKLVLPDGRDFATYYLDDFIDVARSNGTPIANPA